jgi:hypothetical protein
MLPCETKLTSIHLSDVEFVKINQLCGNNLRNFKEESDYKSMCGVHNFFKGHSFQNKK